MSPLLTFLMILIPPFFYGLTNILDYRITQFPQLQKTSTLLLLCNITNALFVPVLFLFWKIQMPSAADMPYLIIIGAIEAFYLFLYFKAYKYLDTSVISALWALSRVLTPLFAFIFVGEILSPIQYAAFFIIIAASIVLGLEPGKKFKVNRGFWLLLIAGIGIVFESAIYKRASFGMDWANLLFWTCTLSTVWSLLILMPRENRADIKKSFSGVKEFAPWFIACEIFQFLGRGAHIFVLTIVPVALFETGLSFQPLLVLGSSWLVCKFWKTCPIGESRSSMARKIACFAVMLLAAFLLI
ncbi:MAG: DMT family transporter [Rickettsiales bacterium]|jgi:drug/metabolite transporter (DMT)-like permease|nr:DMT family transporter [Rickettsiales bacterium]